MFQTVVNDTLQTLSPLLHWSWAHPTAAGLALATIAIFVLVWLHVPRRLEYYWQGGQITVRPFNVRNELPQYVRGRIAVLRFAREHTISLALGRRIGQTLVEFLLKLLWIPNPRRFSWDGGFAAIQVYPLGHSRREYVRLCMTRGIWPWKRTETLQRILDANNGYLPGLQQATAIAALVNRLYT